jgi:predicted CoA-binding protein
VNTRQDIEGFVSQKVLAVVGLSRDPGSFGAYATKELEGKGYRLLPVNPNAEEIRGAKCYPSLQALPGGVHGALFLTPPAATAPALREAVAAGVTHLWIQQGAESAEALTYCQEQGLQAVTGHCILMFAEPVGPLHRVHRLFKGLVGGIPR